MKYAAQLRRILIYSADVLPEEVSSLLKQGALRGRWDVRRQLLKEYRPLVDHLAKDYVDFAIEVLTGGTDRHVDPEGDPYDTLERFGLHEHMEFFPPAHVQGPFLYVLRKNEDQGLRLAQGLCNSAVANWRRKMQARYFHRPRITPLPVMINSPSGPREYWGDTQVYYWFRPMNCGANAVTSALMALEVWLEEQIESGRDAEELFQKVLQQSHCVAVLGLCLGIALAYPAKCLKAVLPIVSSPAVWKMDIARFGADRKESFSFDPLGRYKVI
jgi:hypothetical protein